MFEIDELTRFWERLLPKRDSPAPRRTDTILFLFLYLGLISLDYVLLAYSFLYYYASPMSPKVPKSSDLNGDNIIF